MTADPLWYKDAVIYQLHVRTFCDSNGDGVGDFPGLITKLDYVQSLGVTAIWLLPFYQSRFATTATISRTTSESIRATAQWRTSKRSSPKRIAAVCTCSRSW